MPLLASTPNADTRSINFTSLVPIPRDSTGRTRVEIPIRLAYLTAVLGRISWSSFVVTTLRDPANPSRIVIHPRYLRS